MGAQLRIGSSFAVRLWPSDSASDAKLIAASLEARKPLVICVGPPDRPAQARGGDSGGACTRHCTSARPGARMCLPKIGTGSQLHRLPSRGGNGCKQVLPVSSSCGFLAHSPADTRGARRCLPRAAQLAAPSPWRRELL